MTIETNVRLLAFETLQDIINDKAYKSLIRKGLLAKEFNKKGKKIA